MSEQVWRGRSPEKHQSLSGKSEASIPRPGMVGSQGTKMVQDQRLAGSPGGRLRCIPAAGHSPPENLEGAGQSCEQASQEEFRAKARAVWHLSGFSPRHLLLLISLSEVQSPPINF